MTSQNQEPLTEEETNWWLNAQPVKIVLDETQWNAFIKALEQEHSPEELSRLRRLLQTQAPWEL